MAVGEMDWVDWHRPYADLDSPLSRRLGMVQQGIRAALDAAAPGPIRALSLCAGDGRDLLGVLVDHPRAPEVTAVFVELDPILAATAAEHAMGGAATVEVRCSDATDPDVIADVVPADLVLLCGVLGNVTDDDAESLLRWLPQACASGAVAIWTRHRREPDLTVRLRQVLAEAGFDEIAFDSPPGTAAGVGVARWPLPTPAWDPPRPLFTFTPDKQQSWQR